jgi:hypothetical protein
MMSKVMKNKIILCFIALMSFGKANAIAKDSLDVYLTSEKKYCFNIVFDNKSMDTIIINSCFKIMSNREPQGGSGFVVIMFDDGVENVLPLEKSIRLRFSNCSTTINPNSKVSFEVSMKGFIAESSTLKNVGVELLLTYFYIKKGALHVEDIQTNYVEIFKKEEGDGKK